MPTPKPQKILYIGSLDDSGNSFKRFNTLRKMGYQLEGIDVDNYIFGSVWMRLHFHLYVGPGIISLNRKILKAVDDFAPDLIWVDNKPYVTSNTLNKIKSRHSEIKIVNVITDDPFGKYHYAWRFIYKTFKYYDVHFVQREINISELKRHGANRVELCFRSFDPEFHFCLDEDQISTSYKTEIGFIGSYEDDREEFVANLVQNGIDVKIIGDGWENGRYWNILKSHHKGPSVYGDEYVKVLNGMDIALHFLRKANRDQQDSRTFEIPACGTFMLAERSNLHTQFFKEKEEADFFTSKEDLLSKVQFYINNPIERARIAKQGYNRAYNSGYDHKSRLYDVIDKIYNGDKKNLLYKSIVVSIYYDPDFYPPTINAIINLSELCEELIVVTRNHSKHDFPFPGNVRLVKIGDLMSVQDSERASLIKKIKSFLDFTFCLWNQMRKSNVDLVLLYDAIPLFSYFLTRTLSGRKKFIWYHNHDMPNTHKVRKFSIGWFATKYEFSAMGHIDYFTLPSLDRLRFYPKWTDSNRFFTIPNYPSLKVYKKREDNLFLNDEIKLIFQGTIGEEHALENIIRLLNEKIGGKSIKLVLKGGVRPHYRDQLDELAKKTNTSDKLTWVPLGPYSELPSLTSTCHIGIAIYMGNDNVRKTLGTASNKIYEYAASGLPVILYDNEQFRKYLGQQPWAFFTDGSIGSLRNCIDEIMQKFTTASKQSRASFEEELNFEFSFSQLISMVRKKTKI